MERIIEKTLLEWKERKNKMPLLVFGARQVGKTTTIFNFGKKHFANVVLFNFESNEKLAKIFDADLSPKRIIEELEYFSAQSISKRNTLIFFDEVQDCPKALTSLKYFCEQAPEYTIIAAGSLLGVAVNRKKKRVAKTKGAIDYEGKGVSYPVGKVELAYMHPMNFEEFLLAVNTPLVNAIKNAYANNSSLSEHIHDKALELYRTFLFTGGMPKAVLEYIEKQDFDFVRIRQHEILTLYAADMGKYTTESEQVKINAIYESIPSQLAKENKKFQYSLIGSHARAASYEVGLDWLKSAGLVIKCNKAKEGKISLVNYLDLLSYKIFMSDVGLLNAKSAIPKNMVITGLGQGGEAKGAMTENYVACELAFNSHLLHYWESDGKAEIDFLIQTDEGVIPIEVKSADNVQSKSLKEFVKRFNPPYSIRISSKNFGFENNIKSVPLYAVFCIKA